MSIIVGYSHPVEISDFSARARFCSDAREVDWRTIRDRIE